MTMTVALVGVVLFLVLVVVALLVAAICYPRFAPRADAGRFPAVSCAADAEALAAQLADRHTGVGCDQILTIETRLHLVDGASILFTYTIRDQATGARLAEARSDQVFTALEGDLVMTRPTFQAELFAAWEHHLQGS